MPGPLDTSFYAPPVRIGAVSARGQQRIMQRGATRTSDGADRFGARQGVYASVPLRLRIDKGAGPNSKLAQAGALPSGKLRRKAGYPPLTNG